MGKMAELLARALEATGEVPSKTKARSQAKEWIKKHPDYTPTVQTASRIYRSLTHPEHGLIAALRPLLKEQKHWDKHDCKSFLRTLNHP